MKKEIYYATSNSVKFEEVKLYLDEHHPDIELKQFKEDIVEPQSDNQQDIAIFKAKQAWDKLNKPVLVDDSGIFIHKYKNFPGTLTKPIYQSLGMENIAKLYDDNEPASFILTMVYIYGHDKYTIFENESSGTLKKFNEWHEDPVAPFEYNFVPNGVDKTYTELRKSGEIQQYKYRIGALKKFLKWYEGH